MPPTHTTEEPMKGVVVEVMTKTSSGLSSTVLENTNAAGISEAFFTALLQFLTSSPYIFGTVLLSYISGHFWAYIILSYFSKRERNILYSTFGKLSLGLMWFAIILIPTYIFAFKSFNIIITQLLEILITVLATALAGQFLISFVIIFLHRRG